MSQSGGGRISSLPHPNPPTPYSFTYSVWHEYDQILKGILQRDIADLKAHNQHQAYK